MYLETPFTVCELQKMEYLNTGLKFSFPHAVVLVTGCAVLLQLGATDIGTNIQICVYLKNNLNDHCGPFY